MLLVVIFHAGLPLPGGFIGVDVFFVISGYVITRMLLNEFAETGRLRLGTFYLRRIRRILPALAVLLVFTLGASVLLAPVGGQEVTARTGAAAAYFNANNYLIFNSPGYFSVKSSVNALLHTWSLSVEEQFYLVFPALLLGAWAFARRTRRVDPARAVAVALVAIVVVSFVASWLYTYGRVGPLPFEDSAQRIAFYSSPTRAWEFALGGLLAYFARPLGRLRPTTSLAFSLAGAVAIVWAAFAIDGQTPFPGVAALAPVIGTALLIAAGERAGGNPLNRALAYRPAQRIGDVSYSWYLWHWPLIVFASALWPGADTALVVAAALSIVPAWLSLRYVENPIRFTPRPPTRRTIALAGICIVVPIMAAVGLVRAHERLLRTDSIQALSRATEYHYDAWGGCDNMTPFGERRQPECEWNVADPVGRAVLIGDSNAGQFTEGFSIGANDAGWDATVATMSACPFVDLVPIRNRETNSECRDFVKASVDGLIAAAPDLVVIASSSDAYVNDDDWMFESPNGETRGHPRGEGRGVDQRSRAIDPPAPSERHRCGHRPSGPEVRRLGPTRVRSHPLAARACVLRADRGHGFDAPRAREHSGGGGSGHRGRRGRGPSTSPRPSARRTAARRSRTASGGGGTATTSRSCNHRGWRVSSRCSSTSTPHPSSRRSFGRSGRRSRRGDDSPTRPASRQPRCRDRPVPKTRRTHRSPTRPSSVL